MHFENTALGMNTINDSTAYFARAVSYTCKIYMKSITDYKTAKQVTLTLEQNELEPFSVCLVTCE